MTQSIAPKIVACAIPRPAIRRRNVDPDLFAAARARGLSEPAARVVAARLAAGSDLDKFLSPSLAELDHPDLLPDCERAANRIAAAIMAGEVVATVSDYDSDGVTASVCLWLSLRRFQHPEHKIRRHIGVRLKDGYGLSDNVVDRILAESPHVTLLISADCGSSDEPRIARLAAAGVDCIVTDHHGIPAEGKPTSAYAFVNPTRQDSEYPDPLIAGCMTAFLLMTAVRRRLIDLGYLPVDTPSLTDLLGFLAVGTVADCVSMARSVNNRAITLHGLKHINDGDRACWRSLKALSPESAVTSETIAFKIGPLTNARGRLDDAALGVDFYLADHDNEAKGILKQLVSENERRKAIERSMVDVARGMAAELVSVGRRSIVLFLPDGHAGVHGIVAARLTETFGRPTIVFSPKPTDPTLITGSARGGVPGFHVRQALEAVAQRHPELIVAFGGHKGAAGITLPLDGLMRFSDTFEEVVAEQLSAANVGPVIWTDGELPAYEIGLDLCAALAELEPYGREFEPAAFEANMQIKSVKAVGDGRHLKLTVRIDGKLLPAIWFGAKNRADAPSPVEVGDWVRGVFQPRENVYRSERRLDIQILYVERTDSPR